MRCSATYGGPFHAIIPTILRPRSARRFRARRSMQAIRTATARLQQTQAQNLKDFKHELQSTAADRAGCVFPAGVMRSISEARDRAAAAAAHGIVNPVPTATGGPADDR